MSPISKLIVEALPSGDYRLIEKLTYRGSRDKWVIPAGFVTDLASVPRLLWPLFPPFGRHSRAAVVHDWLYAKRPYSIVRQASGTAAYYAPITRHQADGVFRRIMKELGVGRVRRYLMWAGVRIGGWYVWNRRTK